MQRTPVVVVRGTSLQKMDPKCALSLETSAFSRYLFRCWCFSFVVLLSLEIVQKCKLQVIFLDEKCMWFLKRQIVADYKLKVMEKIRVKKISPSCSCKSDCVGWVLRTEQWVWTRVIVLHDSSYQVVPSCTKLIQSCVFRSRYTLTVDNVETHERLSSGFMVKWTLNNLPLYPKYHCTTHPEIPIPLIAPQCYIHLRPPGDTNTT